MQYNEAVEVLTNGEIIGAVLLFLVAAMVLVVLVSSAVEALKKLFKKQPNDNANAFKKHCEDSEERFKRGERHIAENNDHIADLKEGQRVLCVAVMALLNHDLHNGNADEMQDASASLNRYLINRK